MVERMETTCAYAFQGSPTYVVVEEGKSLTTRVVFKVSFLYNKFACVCEVSTYIFHARFLNYFETYRYDFAPSYYIMII
jgi:hypothetical protein